MRFLTIVILYIFSVISGPIAVSGSLDEDSSVDECRSVLRVAGKIINYDYSGDYTQTSEDFHRLLKETIQNDDDVTTELAFKKCLKHVDTFEHLGTIFKPADWAINYAAESGAEKVVKMLIENEVNVDALYNHGATPLICVARESGSVLPEVNPRSQIYVDIAKMLIDHNANVSATDDYGNSALHAASKYGGEDVARLILAKGVDVNAKTKYGYTPLKQTGEYNKANMTRLLIEKGANISVKTDDGITPFLFAAICGATDVLRVLVENGADINPRDTNGDTAFHHIAKGANPAVIRFLIDNNANKTIRNNDGKTACDIAKERRKLFFLLTRFKLK